jgi:hypothetical protein
MLEAVVWRFSIQFAIALDACKVLSNDLADKDERYRICDPYKGG